MSRPLTATTDFRDDDDIQRPISPPPLLTYPNPREDNNMLSAAVPRGGASLPPSSLPATNRGFADPRAAAPQVAPIQGQPRQDLQLLTQNAIIVPAQQPSSRQPPRPQTPATRSPQPSAKRRQEENASKREHHVTHAVVKLTLLALAVLIALGLHSIAEYGLSYFITNPSWTFGRELLVRIAYPLIAFLILYLIVFYMWSATER